MGKPRAGGALVAGRGFPGNIAGGDTGSLGRLRPRWGGAGSGGSGPALPPAGADPGGAVDGRRACSGDPAG